MKNRALFLDRDGVINEDYGYVFRIEDFKFIDGIFQLVAAAKKSGYLVIIVTNQSGIGRGYYSENDFINLTTWMKKQFYINGGYIDQVYHCPFHPKYGIGIYRQNSCWRKPEPGMILQAKKDFNIDLEKSILIGDKLTDMQAGKESMIGTLLLLNKSSKFLGSINISMLSEAFNFI